MNNNLILVTGAAGYVGSHCLVELLNNGYDVVVIDNCSNSIHLNGKNMPESLIRVQSITGRQLVNFYKEDINNVTKLEEIFNKHRFIAVMHFAALKAVGESCKIPLDYYHNNVSGTITLLEVMRKYGVKKFIFSSSATVYGYPDYLPIDENHRTGNGCTNPYGRTKYFIEEILKDLCASEKGWCVASLRYFNPVGAHESGEIGEDPQGIPNNLMPFISQVAVRRQPFLKVFGNDFKTADGTGVRDYIHIMDLAAGHSITLENILKKEWTGWNVYNFGAGTGYSVLDVIAAFEESTGINIPYKICNRRAGDVDELWADIRKAQNKLNWKPKWTLKDMCAHSWKWQSKYPMGYRTLRHKQQHDTNDGNLNGNFMANNNNVDNFVQLSQQQQQRKEHFLDMSMMENKTANETLLKTKIFKGKRFALEVNNNEEDIIV
ncbi:UDP-glucose 4-epimerase-like isoform X1 [Dermatophagoides pteronyssinus]|uniref:Uncharacterized protein n=2 Tax=Dermatophagoides pteronyssinus TaxID=6956 RepID=A0ABQ8IWV2_DERPT|nr:UDP-glucose 4-epimerase-like isoform X1 [Dermatophagoides pteronyssinus]KAH9414754.1 hypothetical protein DERP_008595 [Dermatophagoides pteronyssinus]